MLRSLKTCFVIFFFTTLASSSLKRSLKRQYVILTANKSLRDQESTLIHTEGQAGFNHGTRAILLRDTVGHLFRVERIICIRGARWL